MLTWPGERCWTMTKASGPARGAGSGPRALRARRGGPDARDGKRQTGGWRFALVTRISWQGLGRARASRRSSSGASGSWDFVMGLAGGTWSHRRFEHKYHMDRSGSGQETRQANPDRRRRVAQDEATAAPLDDPRGRRRPDAPSVRMRALSGGSMSTRASRASPGHGPAPRWPGAECPRAPRCRKRSMARRRPEPSTRASPGPACL